MLIGIAAGARPAAAEPGNHVLRQVTNITVGDTQFPKIRSQDGDSISFIATGDVLGLGTGTGSNRHLFPYEENALPIKRQS